MNIKFLFKEKNNLKRSQKNINSYDQWGVELGKELSHEVCENLNSNKINNNLDSSTNGLINFYKKTRS